MAKFELDGGFFSGLQIFAKGKSTPISMKQFERVGKLQSAVYREFLQLAEPTGEYVDFDNILTNEKQPDGKWPRTAKR